MNQGFYHLLWVDENIPSPQEKGDREAVEEVLHGGGSPAAQAADSP